MGYGTQDDAGTAEGEYRRRGAADTDMLIAVKSEKQKAETDRCKRELKKVDKRIAELSKILNKLCEDMALEQISEERYQAMAPGYEREQGLLKGKREASAAEITRSEEVYDNIEKFLPVIWKYTDITELNARILNELIERIDMHEKVISPDGIKSQRIDIHHKFIGYFDLKEMMRNGVWCQDEVTGEYKLVKPEDLYK